jgi:hypothetical protein
MTPKTVLVSAKKETQSYLSTLSKNPNLSKEKKQEILTQIQVELKNIIEQKKVSQKEKPLFEYLQRIIKKKIKS